MLTGGLRRALKDSVAVLTITLVIAMVTGIRMKKTVADPVNAIAKAAKVYVQDRKGGAGRSDHFASLGIRTGTNWRT